MDSSLRSYLSCDKKVVCFSHMSCVSTFLTKQTQSSVIFKVNPYVQVLTEPLTQ